MGATCSGTVKEMKKIWYLLKCPEEKEAKYAEKCSQFVGLGELKQVVCFQYQRLMRYGGGWHMERRKLLPGYIFLSGNQLIGAVERIKKDREDEGDISLVPCEDLCLEDMCWKGNLFGISKGIIQNGKAVVTSGPLKGREKLIRKIDRHKRTAQIEISIAGSKQRVTVGLEIYEKQMQAESKKE